MRKKKTNPEHNINARAEVKDDGAQTKAFYISQFHERGQVLLK